MIGLIQSFQVLAREAGDATRAVVRRTALIGVALLIATMGAGLLVLAAYIALRVPFGPGLAALALGLALLAVSVGLFLTVRAKAPKAKPKSFADPRQTQQITAPATLADAATLAVFTMAFLIGRRLADRWSQARES
jgi:hypothetical protein